MKLDELKEIVAEELNVSVDELTESTKFIDDLGAMEEKFEIEIPSEDLEKIITVGDAAKYVEEKLA